MMQTSFLLKRDENVTVYGSPDWYVFPIIGAA